MHNVANSSALCDLYGLAKENAKRLLGSVYVIVGIGVGGVG